MGIREEVVKERRRYPRVKSLHLISYINKEGGVQKSGVSMARTINFSPAGVGVEVYQPISQDSLMEMEVAVKERIFSLRGTVIHCQEKSAGKWLIGIEFGEVQEDLAKELS
jgi:hypothetical protein